MLRANNRLVIRRPARMDSVPASDSLDSDALFELEPAAAEAVGLRRAGPPAVDWSWWLPDWAEALAPVEGQLRDVLAFLGREAADGHEVLPPPSNVLRAFRQPLAGVRVLIVGQDPYPTPGHAVGLVLRRGRRHPAHPAQPRKHLQGTRRRPGAAAADPRRPQPLGGPGCAAAQQGPQRPGRGGRLAPGQGLGSHHGGGDRRRGEPRHRATASPAPLVAILWGKDAEAVRPLLGPTPVIASAHPSPLSASRGFFGSRPFSRANTLLQEQGDGTVDWELPPLPSRLHSRGSAQGSWRFLARLSTMTSVPAATSATRKSRPQTNLTVLRREQLSPHMVRIVAGGPGFAGYVNNAFVDRYVKIVFPQPGVTIRSRWTSGRSGTPCRGISGRTPGPTRSAGSTRRPANSPSTS